MPQVFEIRFSQKLRVREELTLHSWRSRQGFAILWIIAIIMAFSVLGSAMVATYNVSLFGQVETGLSLAAENMAESGYRFLFSEYQNQANDVAKNQLLDEIRFVPDSTGKIFNISPDGGGQFQLEMTSYFYRVKTDPNGSSSLALKFIGNAGFSVPDSGFLKVGQDETFYEYTSPPATSADTDGSTIYTFTVTPNVPSTAEYTSVRQVIETDISADVNQGGTLTLESGQGDLFPSENGMFLAMKKRIKEHLPVKTIVPYRYKYDSINGDQLVDIQAGPYQSSFISIDGDTTLIEIAKLLSVDSIGFAPDKASALASETNTFQLSLDITPLSSGLKSYWSFDDATSPAEDDYGVSDGTLSGGVGYTATGKVGGALEFAGTGQVSTTFNPSVRIGNNQSFTVVFWANPDSVSSLRMVLGSFNATAARYFFVGVRSGYWIWAYGNEWQTSTSVDYPLPVAAANQWQHVAFVYNGNDNEVILYVNGIEKYKKPYTGDGIFPDIYIDLGAVYDLTSHLFRFDGTLDEIAIFNTALDICEIREIYDVPCNVGCGTWIYNDLLWGNLDPSSSTPSFEPVAYYPFNCDENDDNQSNCSAGTAVDESGIDKDGNPPDDNDGTVNGAVLATDRFGCEDKTYSFDGSSAYIEVPHSDSLELSDVNKVTIGAWVKKDSAQTGKIAIVTKSDESYILRFIGGNEPAFIIEHETGGEKTAESGITVSNDVWYHLVGTYDGTNVKIYVDGVDETDIPTTATGMEDGSSYNLGIGENLQNPGKYLDGQIDDISIWDQALTADQVLDYYNQTSHK